MTVRYLVCFVLLLGIGMFSSPADAACPGAKGCPSQQQRQAPPPRPSPPPQIQQQRQAPRNIAPPNFGRPPGPPNPPPNLGQQRFQPGQQNQPQRNFGQQQQGPQNQPQRNFGQQQQGQPNPLQRNFGQQRAPQNQIQQGRGPAQGIQNAGLNRGGAPRGQVRVTQSTTIAAHPDRRGMTITHREPNGSQLVVNRRTLPDGRKQTTAYRQIVDSKTHAQTRIYSDGRKITTSSEFVRRSTPGRLQVTNYKNGLRETAMANGRPVFRERFGADHKTVVRTVYTRFRGGRPVVLGAPVEEVYAVVPYNGAVIYPYYPFAFEAGFYAPFLAPFAAPVPVDDFCDTCLPPAAAFAGPAESYSDPNDLLGDMQIATGFDDGMAPPPDAAPPDPEVGQLQSEMASLQDEVNSAENENADLRSQLANQQSEIDSLQQQTSAAVPPVSIAAPVPVSEDVRRQMRKQVKEDVSLHKQGEPLSLATIIASPEAKTYVFQFSDAIDATDMTTGEECSLSTGDLAKFNTVPGEGDAAAELKIATAKTGSCKAGSVVEIGMSDLQDMLNAFSQRLETNMRVVSINLKQKNYSFAPPQ